MTRTAIKVTCIILTWAFFGIQGKAQEEVSKKFLLNSEKVELSTFFVEISPGTSFSSLNGQGASISVLSAASPYINLMSVPVSGSE